ncbi:Spy/CpxP family protein refolding chaperone [Sinorhizobium saheli]|uniref:Spy/CpxP family protein refolding chaperone n=1 Tax=Sinorhizobium saheli TaxID=36856 RepID=UPI001F165A99|nr:Spy/CpxP family protein refolding chaperone [Sinorhizobium saheli]
MTAPEHIEGRIAFLKTELKITSEQEALWSAFAEVLRSNARGAQDGMMQMPGGMEGASRAVESPLQLIEQRHLSQQARKHTQVERRPRSSLSVAQQSAEPDGRQAACASNDGIYVRFCASGCSRAVCERCGRYRRAAASGRTLPFLIVANGSTTPKARANPSGRVSPTSTNRWARGAQWRRSRSVLRKNRIMGQRTAMRSRAIL